MDKIFVLRIILMGIICLLLLRVGLFLKYLYQFIFKVLLLYLIFEQDFITCVFEQKRPTTYYYVVTLILEPFRLLLPAAPLRLVEWDRNT